MTYNNVSDLKAPARETCGKSSVVTTKTSPTSLLLLDFIPLMALFENPDAILIASSAVITDEEWDGSTDSAMSNSEHANNNSPNIR